MIIWLLGSSGVFSPAAGGEWIWQAKIDPWLKKAARQGEAEFILMLAEQADLSGAESLPNKREKGEFVYRQLVATAAWTQRPVLERLAATGVEYRPYWIANMVWVRGNLQVLDAMARREDIAHIYANPPVRMDFPESYPSSVDPAISGPIEWNISLIGAPQVWAEGFTGQGVVVAGQDTGYEWDHPALKSHYFGWDGTSVDHNYHWHDAIHDDHGNPCGSDSTVPCDDRGHGTQTMGIMVGDDPVPGNRIGVAPGARWIGCRNMDNGVGTPITYSECFQWFLAPTDLSGRNPDPSRAPDVINNSWGCTPEEGCTDPNLLRAVVEAVRAAGILVVAAAGNSGPPCASVDSPPALYQAAFSVGSTDRSDLVSLFSSRGPVVVDESQRLKPEVVAPGDQVRSSSLFWGYSTSSGTSMAAPHVAGLAALLISARPELRGDVDGLEGLIKRSARPIQVQEACGGVAGDRIPNHTAGWGRVDALAAYLELLNTNRFYLPAVLSSP